MRIFQRKNQIIIVISAFIVLMIGQAAFAAGGFISGKVTRSDGKTPIVGAHVVADQIMIEIIEAGFGISTANSAGEYIIENLPAGTYNVRVSYPGFADASKSNISVAPSKVTSNIDFILIKSGSISGRLTENDGKTPVSNVEVMAYDISVGVNFSTSDINGSFKVDELLPGTYTIEAEIEGYTFLPVEGVKLEEGENIKGIVIKAHKKYLGQISGKITESDGVTPISGTRIFLISQDLESQEGIIDRKAISGEDGTYSIKELPGGTYVLQVAKLGFCLDIRAVTVPDDTHVNRDISLSREYGSISGYVFENVGNIPIVGAKIFCMNNEFSGVPIEINTTTDAQGKFVLDGLKPGTYSVQVKAEGYALEFKSNINVPPGAAASGINFILGRYAGSISGVIFDKATGEPIDVAFIIVTPSGFVDEGTCGDKVTSDGSYLIDGLKTGNYIAKVGAVGYKTHTEKDLIIREDVVTNINFYLEKE